MRYRKISGKRGHLTYLFKVLTLSVTVVIILLYFFLEKSGSEVKFSSFQKKYAEKNYTFSFSPTDTILVIAPHCDDEVLGAGGFLYDAVHQGARVYVVIVTNGDAFRVFWTGTKKAVELGYRRQNESISALRILGIPREQVFFLGYPDQGLALLWTEHWSSSQPYFSRFTKNWMDSYFTSYRPGSPYSGENLTLELESIISRIQPTVIITASPFDWHPDHWATYTFTMYALEQIRLRGLMTFTEPKIYWYLIHYGIWPYAHGVRPKALLLPPPQLCLPHLDWQMYFPSPFAHFAKSRAIRQYRSQSPLGEHLLSFVRKNELFAQNLVISVPYFPSPIHIDGETTEWTSPFPYQEPRREKIWKREHLFAEFMVAKDMENLYLALSLERVPSSKNTYSLYFYPVNTFDEAQDFIRSFHISLRQNGQALIVSHPEVQAAMKGKTIEIAIPLPLLHHPQSLFFQAEIQRNRKIAGKTVWYLLRLVE